jgi:hypothetical protein
MTKARLILILTLLVNFLLGQDSFNYKKDFKKILEKSKNSADSLAYDKLLDKFINTPKQMTSYQTLALMIGYTSKPEFKPYSDIFKENDIFSLNEAKLFEKVISISRQFLAAHPVNQKTLIELAYAYYKLGNRDSSVYYSNRFNKIMDAMGYSGQGTSPETAMFSLTPVDGQNYVNKRLLKKTGTMGSEVYDGDFLDKVEAVDEKTGTKTMMYFNIQHATFEMKDQINKANKDK